jgi:hypothetical protein
MADILVSSFLFKNSWRISKFTFGLSDFTTRCARGTEDTEAEYSFPLPGDNGKEKTTADRWQIGKRTKMAARRADK